MQERVDHFLAFFRRSDALHHRQMIEHIERGDLGINAELLREIAQQLANLILLLEDVDAVEVDRS